MKVDREGKYINLNERPVRESQIFNHYLEPRIFRQIVYCSTSRPSYRRHQLDHGISQYSMTYRKNLSTYKRLVVQKNRLLKDGGEDTIIKNMNRQWHHLF